MSAENLHPAAVSAGQMRGIDYRIYHDVFVEENKVKGVFILHRHNAIN